MHPRHVLVCAEAVACCSFTSGISKDEALQLRLWALLCRAISLKEV